MIIPKNVKIWLKDLPGKAWVIEEIKDLMLKHGIAYAYSNKEFDEIACVYIYEQSYTFGVSDSCEYRSPFYKASGDLASLSALFPPFYPCPDIKYKINLRGNLHAFQFAQKWAFNNGWTWGSGDIKISLEKAHGIFLNTSKYLNYCSGAHTFPIESGTEIYLSQLLTHNNYGEQVSQQVQGPDQSQPGSTGRSTIRFQSRRCKITVGQRYTGHEAKYYPSRPVIINRKIIGSVPKPSYPGRFDKAEGSQGRVRRVE